MRSLFNSRGANIPQYLEATGGRTERVRRRLDALAPFVRPADLTVPDLTDPRWSPTVAELGLLAEGGGS